MRRHEETLSPGNVETWRDDIPPLGGMSPLSPSLSPSRVAAPDPASAYATKRARRAAWEAWEQAGEPWPPPAGLVSATLDACRGNGANRDRWKR